jgi:deoxyribodipyrimidine photolyase-related protein
MSDYCRECHYEVKERHGDKACPFNSLYWAFMLRHRERFTANPRTTMVYRSWQKIDSETQQALLAKADHYLNHLEDL